MPTPATVCRGKVACQIEGGGVIVEIDGSLYPADLLGGCERLVRGDTVDTMIRNGEVTVLGRTAKEKVRA